MAETINFLDNSQWTKGSPDTVPGLSKYTIICRQKVDGSRMRYAVKKMANREDQIKPDVIFLDGASGKRDPLDAVKNCEFIIEDGNIVAINIDGDCVVKRI